MILELRRCILLLTVIQSFVGTMTAQTSSSLPKRDINAVLAAHDKELLAIPGVVGVYVGVLSDKKTPCLKIMLVRPTLEADRDIPKQLEGYPVIVELTGSAWEDKVVAFLCAAGGMSSYMSVMAFANSLMLDFRSVIVPRFVYATGDAFNDGKLTDSKVQKRIEQVVAELVRFTKALRGR